MDFIINGIIDVVIFTGLWVILSKQNNSLIELVNTKFNHADRLDYPPEVPLDFDKVVAVYLDLSDKAQATFLYRLVNALDPDKIVTIEGYLETRKKKKAQADSKPEKRTLN